MSGICALHSHHEIGCPQCELTSDFRDRFLIVQEENERLRVALDTALGKLGEDAWGDLIRRAFA